MSNNEYISNISVLGEKIRIQMYMEAEYVGDTESRNVVAEITGTEFPNSVRIFLNRFSVDKFSAKVSKSV